MTLHRMRSVRFDESFFQRVRAHLRTLQDELEGQTEAAVAAQREASSLAAEVRQVRADEADRLSLSEAEAREADRRLEMLRAEKDVRVSD